MTPISNLPGDCGDIDASLCEVALATAVGLGFPQRQWGLITGWTVRPTAPRVCHGVTQRFDVVFDLEGEPPTHTVIVGQYPNGAWDACTY